MTRVALSIAGSDSSGGAGIQADARAFAFLRIQTAFAVTAVTAQGVNGVNAIQLVDPDVLAKQIANAFEMYEIGAVKIGMLGSAAQVVAVAHALRKQAHPIVVLDPVLRSTSGAELLDDAGLQRVLSDLLPMATLFTPNLLELKTISGGPVESEKDRVAQARSLFSRGAQAILVKGGHLEADPIDILVVRDEGPSSFLGDRVLTDHDRGTGCTLSSLIAGHLMLGNDLKHSIMLAKQELQSALKSPVIPKRGRGYPVPSDHATHADLTDKISGVYFVSDASLRTEVTHVIGARMALDGGASVVQLRAKEYDTRYLVNLARRMRYVAGSRKRLFIVNDNVDVALASDADGVHLGPGDIAPKDARVVLGPTKIIGASVSTVLEAERIASHCSYLAVGAIFGSSTKGDAGDAVGVERITEIKNAFPDKKIVAIGGINLSNIASVAAAGADAAAVISAIVCADDPEKATRELLAEFERGRMMLQFP